MLVSNQANNSWINHSVNCFLRGSRAYYLASDYSVIEFDLNNFAETVLIGNVKAFAMDEFSESLMNPKLTYIDLNNTLRQSGRSTGVVLSKSTSKAREWPTLAVDSEYVLASGWSAKQNIHEV